MTRIPLIPGVCVAAALAAGAHAQEAATPAPREVPSLACELSMDDLSHWFWCFEGFTGYDGNTLGNYFIGPDQSSWDYWSDPPAVPETPGVTAEAFAEGWGGHWSPEGTDFLTLRTHGTAPGLNQAALDTHQWSPQYGGWQSYRSDVPSSYSRAVPAERVVRDRIYMASFLVSAPEGTPPTRLPDYRFRLGDTGTNGLGVAQDEMTLASANNFTAEPRRHRVYFYAHRDGDGYGPGIMPRNLTLGFDVLDFFDEQVNGESTARLDRVDVVSFDPADLGEGQVLLNQGGVLGEDFVLAGGETIPPPPNPDPFDRDWWVPRDKNSHRPGGLSEQRPISFYPAQVRPLPENTRRLEINYPPGTACTGTNWATAGLIDDPYDSEIIDDVPNGTLLMMEVWLSSTDGATPDNKLSQTRISLQAHANGETGNAATNPFVLQGRAAFFTFNADNNNTDPLYKNVDEAPGLEAPDPLQLETGAKRYVVLIEPQIAVGDTADFRPEIEAILFDGIELLDPSSTWPPKGSGVWIGRESEGNLTINRVVCRLFTLPSEITNASCGN